MAQVEKIARGEGSHRSERRRHGSDAHDRPAAAFPASRTRSPSPANRSCRTPSARTMARSTSCSTSSITGTASELGADAIAAKLRAACYRECRKPRSLCSAPRRRWPRHAGGFKVMVRDIGAWARCLAGGRRRLGRRRQPATGTRRPVQRVPRQTPQMYVESTASAARRWAFRSTSLPDAAALSGRLLHQRLQPVRPHLAGEPARRSAVST